MVTSMSYCPTNNLQTILVSARTVPNLSLAIEIRSSSTYKNSSVHSFSKFVSSIS